MELEGHRHVCVFAQRPVSSGSYCAACSPLVHGSVDEVHAGFTRYPPDHHFLSLCPCKLQQAAPSVQGWSDAPLIIQGVRTGTTKCLGLPRCPTAPPVSSATALGAIERPCCLQQTHSLVLPATRLSGEIGQKFLSLSSLKVLQDDRISMY